MPPRYGPYSWDEAMDSAPVSEQPIHNYQITYRNRHGVEVTEIVEADSVEAGELYEFWIGPILMVAIHESNMIEVRNISLMMEQVS